MKKRPKIEYFVNEVISKPVSRKEFLNRQKEEIIGDCVLQSVLLNNKSFTKSQINQLIKEKILSPIEYKSKTYFKKDKVLEALKHIAQPPKLFSL